WDWFMAGEPEAIVLRFERKISLHSKSFNCEVNLDDCKSKPCDYGRCIDKINGYECACEPGYTGERRAECTGVDECSSNPCIHGRCQDLINGYKCTCDSGWSGQNCDINNNECESNPCMNGGTCKDMTQRLPLHLPGLPELLLHLSRRMARCASVNLLLCQIVSTHFNISDAFFFNFLQGQTCEIDINECVKSPCRNGAVCLNTMGGYQCKCLPGYTGQKCETDIDDCKPSMMHLRRGSGSRLRFD
uniref:EGF-like domain-containing protein n=1 Tax=Salarias fasciatus TaxID=181472 RepID=A0A672HTE0_SALFA